MFEKKGLLVVLLVFFSWIVFANGNQEQVKEDVETITVWDYYGESSPIIPIIDAFEAENPGIKVQVESLDWDSMLEKVNVTLAGGLAPDVITIDMTWLPTFAPIGIFRDLNSFANGKLNGKALNEVYSKGAIDSMSYDEQIIVMLYDFDTYALYYRADVLEEYNLEVPATWDELISVGKTISANGKNKYAVLPDSFHAAQFVYENGGDLMSPDNKNSALLTSEAVGGVEFYTNLVDEGVGYLWSYEEGWEITPGLKDGRIAMFSDGPYYMGIMKDAAPEMAGKWMVAPHPTNNQPGSYLGGTGLVIPQNSEHPEAAWKFIEFAMTVENQIGVYTDAGAAPALLDALESPEVNQKDPYFRDQKTLSVFLETMETARPFPYIREWSEIDEAISTAIEEILFADIDAYDAMKNANKKINESLLK